MSFLNSEGIVISARVKNKVATPSEWSSANPVLLKGEYAVVWNDVDDSFQTKIGDGVRNYNDLPFVSQGPQGEQGEPGIQGPIGPSFVIEGELANTGLLPSSPPDDIGAYLIPGSGGVKNVWVWNVGAETWENAGPIGIQGPQDWGVILDKIGMPVVNDALIANSYLSQYNNYGDSLTTSILRYPVKKGNVYLLIGTTKSADITSGPYLIYTMSNNSNVAMNTIDDMYREEAVQPGVETEIYIMQPIVPEIDGYIFVTQNADDDFLLTVKEVENTAIQNTVDAIRTQVEYGTSNIALKLAVEYVKRVEAENYTVSISRQKALYDLMQNLYNSGLHEKLIYFLPFFGGPSVLGYNVTSSDMDAEVTVFPGAENPYDNRGLVGGQTNLLLPFKLYNIPYRGDGQPAVGFGMYLTNEVYATYRNFNFWNSIGDDNYTTLIKYINPDGDAEVLIGNDAQALTGSLSDEGGYYYAQRDGNKLQVFGDAGLGPQADQSGMYNRNLFDAENGSIQFQNAAFINTEFVRCVWVCKALTETEERQFFSFISQFKNSL